MKVLVIPDVHLKPWMFIRAGELLKSGIAEQAVCLMDIADDWRQEFNIDLYTVMTGKQSMEMVFNCPAGL